MYPESALKVTAGVTKVYESSPHGRRHFCGSCGTGLFYYNQEMLPGVVDVQSATYDHPELIPARVQIQVLERIPWMEHAHQLPSHQRYPARE
jgi:hypothetical protein